MADNSENIGGVSISVTGDLSPLETDFKRAEELAKQAGQNISSALAAGAMGPDQLAESLTTLVSALGAVAQGAAFLVNPVRAAQGALEMLAESIGIVGIAVVSAGAAVGILAKQITDLVIAEGAAAEKTQNFADRLQLSFQDTQKLSEMAQIAGVSVGVLERASARLAVAFEDSDGSGKKVAAALDKMGIAANGTGDTLVKLLEHLASIPSASERIAEATAVMGRGAIQLEPLLKNYAGLQSAVEALGGHISDDMVAKLTAADDASDKLGIAWGHLKENLAAAFAPAVTVGLDTLTHLFSGTPETKLDDRIAQLGQELIELKNHANDAKKSLSFIFADSTGLSEPDGGQAAIDAKQKALDTATGQRDAIARSKEYNDEIDKSNRLNEIWVQGQYAREKAAVEAANAIAKAQYEENKQAVELQKAEAEQSKQLLANLKFFHVELSDPAVEQARIKLAQLIEAQREGKISLSDLTKAQTGFNKVFGFDFTSYLEHAITLTEQMDQKFQKLNESISHQRDLLRSPEFTDTANAVLQGIDVPSDADRDARKKGTLLGDTLLGLRIDRDDDTLKNIKLLTDLLKDQDATLQEVNLGWAQASGDLRKLGTVDLPKAIELYDKYIKLQQDEGAAAGRIFQLRQQELQLIIQEKTLRGESATAEIVALENIRLKQEALVFSSQALGKVYVGLIKDFEDAFQALGKGIADNIVDGKNWGDVWQSIIKQVEKSILETLIGSAFKALEAEIIKLIAMSDKLGGSLKGIGGALSGIGGSGSGEVLKEGARLPGGISEGIGEGSGEAGGEGGGGGGEGGASAIGGAVPIIGLGVAVASGITQGIQGAQMVHLLGEIEVSTRQAKEQLTGGIQFALNTYLPELKHLVDLWGAIQDGFGGLKPAIVQLTEKLNDFLSNTPAAREARKSFSGNDAPADDPVNMQSADAVVSRSPGRLGGPVRPIASSVNVGGSAINLLAPSTEELQAMANEVARNLYPVLHPDEYAAQQRKLVDDPFFAKVHDALLGGTNDLSFTNGSFQPTFSGNDAGIQRMTGTDALAFAKALVTGEGGLGGIRAIQDPLAEAKRAGMEDAVRASIIAGFKDAKPAPGSQDEALLLYASGKTTLQQYQSTVADLTVAQMRLQSEIAHSSGAYQEATRTLTAYEQQQLNLTNSARNLQSQIDGLQHQFFLNPSAAASTALSARVNQMVGDAGVGGIAGLQGAGSSGPMPGPSPEQNQLLVAQFSTQLQSISAARDQQTAAATSTTAMFQSGDALYASLVASGNPPQLIKQFLQGKVRDVLDQYNSGTISYQQYIDANTSLQTAVLRANAAADPLHSRYLGTRAYGAAPIDYAGSLANFSANVNTSWTTAPIQGPGTMQGGNSVGNVPITIIAADNSSRSIGRGVIQVLQQNGYYR